MKTKFAQIPNYLKVRSSMAFRADERESRNKELKNLD